MLSSTKQHEELLDEIHLELGSNPKIRLFKRVVGFAKTENGNSISFGYKGEPDLQGFVKNPNGPAFYLAIEVKTGKAVLSKDQKRWKKAAEKLGVIYIVARSKDQVLQDLKNYI